MSTVRYEILLPLRYNDGTPVEQEKFMITRRELLTRFEGLTMEPQGFRGIWIYEGIEYEDELIRFVLDVEDTPETEAFFREYKKVLKERFKQLDIWMTIHPISIL